MILQVDPPNTAGNLSCRLTFEPLKPYLEAHTLPPFLGDLVLWLGSVILKSRRPKKRGRV